MEQVKQHFELLILGGGPAGYTAAIYGARAGLRTAVLEKLAPGGQMALTEKIENYPGIEPGISGTDLAQKMRQSAEAAGAESIFCEITEAALNEKEKLLTSADTVFSADALIIAAGADPRPLGVPNEAGWIGHGLSYCASCDGMLYRGKTVAVVGGGNSAVSEALTLSGICEKVYLIHRRESFRADRVLLEAAEAKHNIEILRNCAVRDLLGAGRLNGISLLNKVTGTIDAIPCSGVFAAVGRIPASERFRDQLQLNRNGYILTDEEMRTSIPGVFAAGDIRAKEYRQIVTAAADGAIAACSAEKYLQYRQPMPDIASHC